MRTPKKGETWHWGGNPNYCDVFVASSAFTSTDKWHHASDCPALDPPAKEATVREKAIEAEQMKHCTPSPRERPRAVWVCRMENEGPNGVHASEDECSIGNAREYLDKAAVLADIKEVRAHLDYAEWSQFGNGWRAAFDALARRLGVEL